MRAASITREKHLRFPNLRIVLNMHEIAEFLKRLIQFDSETGKEGPIQDFIAASLAAMGLQVDKWVPDLSELAKHPAYIPAKGRDFSGRPNVVGIHRGDELRCGFSRE